MQAESHPGHSGSNEPSYHKTPPPRSLSLMDEATIISLFAESPSPSPSSRKATFASATVLLSERREGKRICDVGIFLFREKKNFCKEVTDPHSLFCFIVIAIVFFFQWLLVFISFMMDQGEPGKDLPILEQTRRLIPTRQRAPRRWRQPPSRPQIR